MKTDTSSVLAAFGPHGIAVAEFVDDCEAGELQRIIAAPVKQWRSGMFVDVRGCRCLVGHAGDFRRTPAVEPFAPRIRSLYEQDEPEVWAWTRVFDALYTNIPPDILVPAIQAHAAARLAVLEGPATP